MRAVTAAPAPSPSSPTSAVYEGSVWHTRDEAPGYAFRQPVWMLYVDLDEREALRRRAGLLGCNRPRPVELRDADHFRGARRDDLRARLGRVLASAGLRADGPVRVLTQGRVLGQGFNPVSFWWCHDAHGDLVAAVAEVNNTFGDRHPYVLPAAEAERTPRGLVWTVKKRMHVSPFFDLDGSYRFELGVPGERLELGADLLRAGTRRIHAGFVGTRRPLTDGALARALLRLPFMPWRVWTMIHAHAWRLWRRGARYHRRPSYDPVLAGTTVA